MILLIDWGNTYLKYLIVEETAVAQYKFNINDVRQTSLLTDLLTDISKYNNQSEHTILKTYVSSVRKTSDNQNLSQALNGIKLKPIFVKTVKNFSGITCAYNQVENLGIDRWLAIVAAFSPKTTTGIIDIGSAITLDVVSQQGQHLGGQIIPGNRLLLESLKTTGKINLSKNTINESHISLGHSTDQCVGFGIDKMIQSYLHCSILDLTKEHQVGQWILTGGGGEYWTKKLSASHSNIAYDGLLIFKGLIKYENEFLN